MKGAAVVMALAAAGSGVAAEARRLGAGAECVWNQAYEEQGNNDVLGKVQSGASQCYVLLDTDEVGSTRECFCFSVFLHFLVSSPCFFKLTSTAFQRFV
jgi:uncharacterized protein (DUF1800 family)